MFSLFKVEIENGPFPKTTAILDEVISKFVRKRLSPNEVRVVQSHVAKVADDTEVVVNIDTVSLGEAAAFLEWIDGARSVDPHEFPKAAEKWQEALRRLLGGSRDMLSAIQKISPQVIERFEQENSFTLDDAIEFEKLGLGSVMPVGRLGSTSTAFPRVVYAALGLTGILIIISVLLAVSLQASGVSAGIIAIASIAFYLVFWLYVWAWDTKKVNSRILPKVFHPVQKFWISAKGQYVLTTVFGRNPNKTVFWNISPADEAKTEAHIAATPDVNRAFGSA